MCVHKDTQNIMRTVHTRAGRCQAEDNPEPLLDVVQQYPTEATTVRQMMLPSQSPKP